jgi:hypothetical protein
LEILTLSNQGKFWNFPMITIYSNTIRFGYFQIWSKNEWSNLSDSDTFMVL